jgi:DnaJ-class molecular chaperone
MRPDVDRVYHRLASQLHPDHNPDDPEAEARMTELTQAYDLLTAYAENVQRNGGAGEQGCEGTEKRQSEIGNRKSEIRFSQEAVEQTLLIAIRRQDVPT